MTDDIHSFAREIDALDEIIADANADKAEVYQRAKKALREDLPAFREAMAQRRKRDKNPAAYEALKGTAAEYLDALDNGVVVEHARTRAPARRPKSSTGGGGTPQPDPTQAVSAHSLAPDVPPVEPVAETDRAETPEARPRDAEEEEPPRPDPDAGWQAKDGHDSYVLALRVGNGAEPHPADAGPLPHFLDRRGRA